MSLLVQIWMKGIAWPGPYSCPRLQPCSWHIQVHGDEIFHNALQVLGGTAEDVKPPPKTEVDLWVEKCV